MAAPRQISYRHSTSLRLKDKNLPAGTHIGAEYVKLQYETAARQGRPMPKLTPEHVGKWAGVNFIFPNLLIFPQAGLKALDAIGFYRF